MKVQRKEIWNWVLDDLPLQREVRNSVVACYDIPKPAVENVLFKMLEEVFSSPLVATPIVVTPIVTTPPTPLLGASHAIHAIHMSKKNGDFQYYDEIKENSEKFSQNAGFINKLQTQKIPDWPPFVCQIKKRIYSKKVNRYLLKVDDGDGTIHKVHLASQLFWGIKEDIIKVGDWVRIVYYGVTIINPEKSRKLRFILFTKIETLKHPPTTPTKKKAK